MFLMGFHDKKSDPVVSGAVRDERKERPELQIEQVKARKVEPERRVV